MSENSQPLELGQALEALQRRIVAVSATETLPLSQAVNRVTAAPVQSPVDIPPFPASAMDGYAVRQEDWAARPADPFRVIGHSLAGHPFSGTIGRQEAVRVFTGAVVPDTSCQVLLQEDVLSADEHEVTFKTHTPGELFVRPPGHDFRAGQTIIGSNRCLTPLMLGALSAAGIPDVSVYVRPRVGVFSTGDELVDPTVNPADLEPGQIYDSNRFTVLSILADSPIEPVDLGRLPDDETKVRQAIEAAARDHDVLLTSGGVSVGDADFITSVIRELGKLEFWKLNLKPGKPLAYGTVGKCHVFGLPGNPVSTIVTLLMIAKPALYHLAGADMQEPLRIKATTADRIPHSPGRTEYQRGTLKRVNGMLSVTHTGDQSSNRLSTFVDSNCLIEIPGQTGDVEGGQEVLVLPLSELLS